MRHLSVIYCCIMLFLASCDRGHTHGSMPVPSVAVVAGTYLVHADTLTVGVRGKTGSLQLKPDGSFVMQNVPGWWETGEPLGSNRTWSGHGQWAIVDQGVVPPHMPRYRLRLDFTELNGTPNTTSDHTPYVVQRDGVWSVHMPVGDPDEGDEVVLVPQ
jgi:hypothetical protein